MHRMDRSESHPKEHDMDDRDARGEMASRHGEGVGHFALTDLERMSRQFREERKARGPSCVDAQWVDMPFQEWLDSLTGRRPKLHPDTMAAIAVGMREALSIRDALILSLIAEPDQCPKRRMLEFAVQPHKAETRRRVNQLLSDAFDDDAAMPDWERCHAGVMMMADIAEAMPVPYCVQPLAVMAYMLWWLGDPRAAVFTARCLAIDGDCSLAAMVHAALEHDVGPAWRS